MRRVVLCIVALVGVTAFAPAPLPRSSRLGDHEVSLRTLRGKWWIVSLERAHENGKTYPVRSCPFTEVTIDGNRWAFDGSFPILRPHGDEVAAPTSVPIAIDNSRSPAVIDFGDVNGEQGRLALGIIRRDGDRVELVFAFGDPDPAKRFDSPPRGHLVLKLRRKR
jgi:hypothetical protein